jgi:uncharacterized membrane protein
MQHPGRDLTPYYDKSPPRTPDVAPARPAEAPFSRMLPFFILSAVSAAFSIPFSRSIPFPWTEMNGYLHGAVFSLAAAVLYLSWLDRKLLQMALLCAVAIAVSYAAESAGVRGDPVFGYQYHYSPAISPVLPGGVPLCIPLMWFMLAYTPLVFLRRYSIRPKGRLAWERLLVKSALCALFITASDFVIEPLGVFARVWFWHEAGDYFGAPVRNFAGWFMVGMVISGCYLVIENSLAGKRPEGRRPSDRTFGRVSIVLMWICFLFSVFHIKSVFPAALACAVMLPYWVYWSVSIGKPGHD